MLLSGQKRQALHLWHSLITPTVLQVYDTVMQGKGRSFPERIHKFHQRDPLAGKLYVLALALMYLLYMLLCFLQPQEVRKLLWRDIPLPPYDHGTHMYRI